MAMPNGIVVVVVVEVVVVVVVVVVLVVVVVVVVVLGSLVVFLLDAVNMLSFLLPSSQEDHKQGCKN